NSNGWLKTTSLLSVRVIIGARLPRVGVGDNRSTRTSDESLRCRICYRRLQERRREEGRAEVLRSQNGWRHQLARIAGTEVIGCRVCDSAKGCRVCDSAKGRVSTETL